MREPKQILEEIQVILGRVSLADAPDSSAETPAIQAKLNELRALKVDESLVDLVDHSSKVLLKLEPGDIGSTISYVLCEIDNWNRDNPVWFGHLA